MPEPNDPRSGRGAPTQPVVVDAVCEAIDAVEAAARAVDDGVADRDMAASADQALRAAPVRSVRVSAPPRDAVRCKSGPPPCGGVR